VNRRGGVVGGGAGKGTKGGVLCTSRGWCFETQRGHPPFGNVHLETEYHLPYWLNLPIHQKSTCGTELTLPKFVTIPSTCGGSGTLVVPRADDPPGWETFWSIKGPPADRSVYWRSTRSQSPRSAAGTRSGVHHHRKAIPIFSRTLSDPVPTGCTGVPRS